MSNVIPFDFNTHAIRVIEHDGEVWFVASDIARALDYRDAHNMCRRLDDDEKGTHKTSTPNSQDLLIISESGLYSAILRSRKEEAKAFKKWVTSQVLPSIRRTGRYEKPVETLTPGQQRHVQKLVNSLARLPVNSHAELWRKIKDRFNVAIYRDIPAEKYPEVCRFLGVAPLVAELTGSKAPTAAPTTFIDCPPNAGLDDLLESLGSAGGKPVRIRADVATMRAELEGLKMSKVAMANVKEVFTAALAQIG